MVLAPVIIGFGLGPKALGGMLAGALVCCVMMALMMANAGGAWDNAKKFVEKGNLGGKGSDVHKAAVVGDTVGDPLKDTSGPAMNILINVMAIVIWSSHHYSFDLNLTQSQTGSVARAGFLLRQFLAVKILNPRDNAHQIL